MKPLPPALAATIRALDAVSIWSGKATAWLILPMVGSLVYEVIARYVFDAPTIWAYDMTYMIYGVFFMMGAAFTLQRKGHIRTDSFYGNWTPRVQGAVDAFCYVVFYFPGLGVFAYVNWDFFLRSLGQSERVVSSPWMPVIYPVKGFMFLAVVLLLLQGLSELLKSCWAAKHGEWP